MRILIIAGALVASVIGIQAEAFAQVTKAPVYRYCLQEGGAFRGGSGMTWCRFDTWAQCWASRTGPADFCYLNPAYSQKR